MSHPVRARLVVALSAKTSSPKRLSDEFGEPLGNVAYHVRVLERDGFVELVSTEPRRGATEHYYRATQRLLLDDEVWADLPANARASISSMAVGEMLDDLGAALSCGSFDARPDRHLTWMRLRLDEEGWTTLAQRLADVFATAGDLEVAAVNRAAESGEELLAARMVLAQYLAPTTGAD